MKRTVVTLALLLSLAVPTWAATEATAPQSKPAPHPGGAKPELPPELREQLEGMKDILDIRPPVAYGADPRWWTAAAGVVLLALGALLVAGLRRRKGRRTGEAPGPRPISPDASALTALSALRAESGLADKAFYFRLCEVARAYLDGRFGADTLEKTTEELVPVLRALPLEAQHRADLIGLFREADPVRYADAAAAPESRQRDLALVEAVVRATAKGEEPSGVSLR